MKEGRVFSFQDMFEYQALYGDMREFIEVLRKEIIAEIHYIPNIDQKDFIPGYIRAPWMLQGLGLLCGRK